MRVTRHILFWLLYLILQSYMGAELTNPSYVDETMWFRISKVLYGQLLLLPPKIFLTYFSMYFVLPKVLNDPRKITHWLWVLGSVAVSVIMYRWLISYAVRPLVYDQGPYDDAFSIARLLWSLFEISAVVGVAISIKVGGDRINSIQNERALVEEKLLAELRFLQAQLNPHFLFNTLNNLYGLALAKSEHTADSILQLSEIMRYALYESQAKAVPLSRELEVVENFITLEQLRLSDTIHIEIQNEVKSEWFIPPLLLLTLVENAFKHGAHVAIKKPFVTLKLQESNNSLIIQIENSYDPNQPINEEGIGLKNIRRQLDLTYGSVYAWRQDKEEDRFRIQITLPNHEF